MNHYSDLFQAELFRKARIGGRDIVLSTHDYQNFRRIEPRGIRLIGFKKMKTLKDTHRMKAGSYLFPIEEVGSKAVLKIITLCLGC